VISHTLWQTWFAGDPSVIGRAYQIAGESRTVIAVMGPRFRFPTDETLLWLPGTIRTAAVSAGAEAMGRSSRERRRAPRPRTSRGS
jgi:hypothetical protein